MSPIPGSIRPRNRSSRPSGPPRESPAAKRARRRREPKPDSGAAPHPMSLLRNETSCFSLDARLLCFATSVLVALPTPYARHTSLVKETLVATCACGDACRNGAPDALGTRPWRVRCGWRVGNALARASVTGRAPASYPRPQAQALPARIRQPAAIDRQSRAVDESAALGVGKERDGLRDILRSCEARLGHAVDDVTVGIGTATLVGGIHLGLDPGRTDGVDAHAAPAPLGRKGPGQPDQSVLGGVVRASVGDAGEAGHRGHVHDRPGPPPEHLRAQIFAQQKRTK